MARVRKTAPTVRQKVEAATAEAEKANEPRRVLRNRRPGKPLGQRQPFKAVAPVWRPIRKVLRFLVPKYFVNSWRELRQVTWPGRKETWRLTVAVFVFAIIFGTLVAIVDKGLDEIFKKVILK
jgi:preprotein translocase SecE subunit